MKRSHGKEAAQLILENISKNKKEKGLLADSRDSQSRTLLTWQLIRADWLKRWKVSSGYCLL